MNVATPIEYPIEEVTQIVRRPKVNVDQVLRNHEGAIRAMARQLANPAAEEDLAQEGRLALWRATLAWREDGGANVWTYAKQFVYCAMLTAVRKAKARGVRNAPRKLQHVDIDGFDPSSVDATEEILSVQEAIETLNEGQQRVVRMAMDGKTFEEIGAEMRCSNKTAHQIYHAAIDYLRDRLS